MASDSTFSLWKTAAVFCRMSFIDVLAMGQNLGSKNKSINLMLKKNKSTHLMKSDKHKHVTTMIIICISIVYLCMYPHKWSVYIIYEHQQEFSASSPPNPPPQRVVCPRPPSFHLQLWDLPVASGDPNVEFR